MEKLNRPPGKTTIEPHVLINIAKLTTLTVPGVKRLSIVPSTVDRIFQRGLNDGVLVNVEDNLVSFDIYLILDRDSNVIETSRAIQTQVSRAISEMVGMDVGRIDIHIEDINYASPSETE